MEEGDRVGGKRDSAGHRPAGAHQGREAIGGDLTDVEGGGEELKKCEGVQVARLLGWRGEDGDAGAGGSVRKEMADFRADEQAREEVGDLGIGNAAEQQVGADAEQSVEHAVG